MRLKFAGCHIVQFLSDDLASPPHFPCGLWAHAKKEPRCSTSKTYTASPSGGSLGMFQTQQIAEESPWEPKSKGLGWLGIRDKKFANLGFVVGLTLWTWDWIFQRLNFGAQAGLEWATLNRSESGRKLSDSMARHRKNCSDVDLDVEFWFLFHTYIYIYISFKFWFLNFQLCMVIFGGVLKACSSFWPHWTCPLNVASGISRHLSMTSRSARVANSFLPPIKPYPSLFQLTW